MILQKDIVGMFCSEIKKKNMKLVFTNGCFDIIHSGHVYYLNEAKKLGDFLMVGLNTDNSVKRIKGETRPLNNESDRAYVLDNLKPVDFVVLFDEDTPLELVKIVNPDILVKGADYKPDEIVGGEFVLQNGGEIRTIKLVEGKSTSSTIEKIKKAEAK